MREQRSANQQVFGIAGSMSAEFEMQINPKSVFSALSSVESQLSAVPASLPVTPLIIHSLISPTARPLLFCLFSFLPPAGFRLPSLDYTQKGFLSLSLFLVRMDVPHGEL